MAAAESTGTRKIQLSACLPLVKNLPFFRTYAGAGVIAQLVEHLVRNEKVRGSNPLDSTNRRILSCVSYDSH